MCTNISLSTEITGVGKGRDEWFRVTRATVGYDHATQIGTEHALLLDFANYEIGPEARIAVELNLESARALLEQLAATIAAAEASGVPE